MKTKNILLSLASALVWYYFIYYWLFTIKNDVNLWANSFILLILAGLGIYLCPWFRESDFFKKMHNKE